MPQINVKEFKGSRPRVAKHLLEHTTAAYALDCKFHKGMIQSWRDTKKLQDYKVAKGNKLMLIECCWVELPLCADIAYGGVDCHRVYATGRSDFPEVGLLDRETCSISWQRLGLPCPYKRPSIVFPIGKELTKEAESRAYVYQFENNLGERSALSPPSVPQVLDDGTKVVVSDWETPPKEWNVVKVRIYRSAKGVTPDNNPINKFNSEYMFVGETDINAPSFIDDKRGIELTEAAEEDLVIPPPATMRGVTSIGGMNALAGYDGNRLYFSKNNEYHNWSTSLTLDDNICAIQEVDGNLYVMTDGTPYVVKADADCKTAGCREVIRHAEAYPMIGCGNRHTARLTSGAVYPTKDGLVLLSGNAVPTYISSAIYSPEDWQAFLPERIMPVAYQDYLFVFSPTAAFVMRQPGTRSEWTHDFHSSLSDRDVINTFVSRNGELILVKPDGPYKWEGSAEKRDHVWASPDFLSGVPMNFGSFKIVSREGQEQVRVFSDDREILNRNTYDWRNVFTLPLWGTGERFRIELKGTADVHTVSLATSNKEHEV